MNIVIIGAGSIGSHLAGVLSQEDHNVVVIDRDSKALEKLSRSADVAARLGSGTDWRLLQEIYLDFTPDFFIAMSSDDATNLAACVIAKHLNYPKTVARIRQNSFLDRGALDFQKMFCVDYILGTERIIAEDIFKCLLHPGHLAVENFAHGDVQMRTVVIPAHFAEVGKSLSDVKLTDELLIGLIRRKMEGGKEEIIFPKGQDKLLAGDEATLIGKTTVMNELHKLLGLHKKTVRSAVLIGGSGVAVHLAQLLANHKIQVKIIEQNDRKCEMLARMLPSAIILNHDGTDFHFLQEEKVFLSDVFVACTESHETNVLTALLGKKAGCQEVVALVSDDSVVPLLQSFQIAYALSEKASIARRIEVILHEGTFVSLASLYDNQANVMEVKISERSHFAGESLASLSGALPKNFLIAMIEGQNGIVIPNGSTRLSAGDTAIVICGPESVPHMDSLL